MDKEKKDKTNKRKTSKKGTEYAGTETPRRGDPRDDPRGDAAEDGRTPAAKLPVDPAPRPFRVARPENPATTPPPDDVHGRNLAELLEAFRMFDFDRDGVIDCQDLKKTFASLCMETDEEEVHQMLSEALNPLNFDAFVILLGCRTLDLDPEEVLLDALSTWDDHHHGLISYDGLLHHIMAWGDRFTEEEAVSALADAPIVISKTKEKMIDYIQFSEDLCGLRKVIQRRANEDIGRSPAATANEQMSLSP